jgi:hypothetical protein
MRLTKRQREIAAKIADACLQAVNSGAKILPPVVVPVEGTGMCPLGALCKMIDPSTRRRYPGMNVDGIENTEAFKFMAGFDGSSVASDTAFMTRLGRSYREWSAKKYGWAP